jgi:hypothetical protein
MLKYNTNMEKIRMLAPEHRGGLVAVHELPQHSYILLSEFWPWEEIVNREEKRHGFIVLQLREMIAPFKVRMAGFCKYYPTYVKVFIPPDCQPNAARL